MNRRILNADDLGYDPAVTRGIVEAMRHGVVSSTTMIVNSPWSEDAAQQATGLAVGLHLNLVRFAAVSEPGRELDEQTPLDAAFVYRETLAQLDRLRALLGREATHLDVHKHAHLRPEVLDGLARAAKERSLAVRSITDEMRRSLRARGVRTNDAFLGDAGQAAYWTAERWLEQLDLAPREGVVELMCHPGYRPSHVSSGYGAQREVELATFLAPAAREALQRRGLTLESWAGV
ncbi:MAG: carbohydrate deacetylase [Myxococcota bacterium]